MDKNILTAEKSLDIITQVIKEARSKFEENGFIYMFWGALSALTSVSQFILLEKEYYAINWYPYLLMPLGAIYTIYYFSKKKNRGKPNQISKIISLSWAVISLDMMILGFLFSPDLKQNLIPFILLLLSVGIVLSGVSVKSKLLLFSGIFINISAFICFKIDWIYQPLLMGIVSVIAVFIPGVLLMMQHKRNA